MSSTAQFTRSRKVHACVCVCVRASSMDGCSLKAASRELYHTLDGATFVEVWLERKCETSEVPETGFNPLQTNITCKNKS